MASTVYHGLMNFRGLVLWVLCVCSGYHQASAQERDLDLGEIWHYNGKLAEVIAQADMAIVMEDDSFYRDSPNAPPPREPLYVRDPADLAALNASIDIMRVQVFDWCYCDGDPVIQWWRGAEILAMLRVQHGRAVRSNIGFPGDARLTPQGSIRLMEWLIAHGFPGRRDELVRQLAELKAMPPSPDEPPARLEFPPDPE